MRIYIEKYSCDFSSCLFEVQKKPRLIQFHAKDVCERIIEDIQSHQDDFLPSKVDGYFINKMGHELVHMKRKDSDGNSVTGFIEAFNGFL